MVLAALAALVTAALPTSASACRFLSPRSEQLAAYPVVVRAEIVTAERLDSPGWNLWRLTAQSGPHGTDDPSPHLHTFQAALSSNGCGVSDLPPPGEAWLLFFDDAEASEVRLAMPEAFLRARLPDFEPALNDE